MNGGWCAQIVPIHNKNGCHRSGTSVFISFLKRTLESARSLELNNGLSCDFNLLTCCGVNTLTCSTLNLRESTKTNKSHLFTCLYSTCDSTQSCIKSLLCINLAQACLSGDSIYQFCFVHDKTIKNITM